MANTNFFHFLHYGLTALERATQHLEEELESTTQAVIDDRNGKAFKVLINAERGSVLKVPFLSLIHQNKMAIASSNWDFHFELRKPKDSSIVGDTDALPLMGSIASKPMEATKKLGTMKVRIVYNRELS